MKEVADAALPRLFRQRVGSLARLVPYRLFIPSTDEYVSAVLHEQFHAFQAEGNGRRFERARAAYAAEARYPWDNPGFQDAWMEEVESLWAALEAPDRASRVGLVARFIASREARRKGLLPDAGALTFERELEWLEGLAKYVELTSWRLAAQPGYVPSPEIRDDPQFHGYGGYQSRWKTERMNMGIRANLHGDVPFYYSGALQAMLLDDLEQGWKAGFVESDSFLDDLLSQATERERR